MLIRIAYFGILILIIRFTLVATMDIFKLFFEHDMRLDKLARRNANKTKEEVEATLEDFMKPTPTYSKFYITGTRLDTEQFGLNVLEKYEQVLEKLDEIFGDKFIHSSEKTFNALSVSLPETEIGQALVINQSKEIPAGIEELAIDEESNVGHRKEELSEMLKTGAFVLYKEQAHHGFDLHLFSLKNIYTKLFYPLQSLVDRQFRFFSINSKRIQSERHFYFETWTLDKPPHGAEEVFPETVL